MSIQIITLSQVVEADLPNLVQIKAAADQDQAVMFPFFFHDSSPELMYQFFMHRLKADLENPACQIIKATDTQSGDIVAFVCMTRVGPDGEGGETNNIPATVGMKIEFAVAIRDELAKLRDVMNGREHFSMFFLLSKHKLC